MSSPWRWMHGVFVLSLVIVNPYVRGDGNGYYAWLVSPVIDGDFDFENQYRHGDSIFQPVMFEADGRPRADMITPTGRLGNQWSVGPAVLWLPWFMAAHAGVQIARTWAPDLPADGYSWPYRYACAIGTACYGWLGLLFARRSLDRLGLGAAAPFAILAAWGATPLPIYQYFLPFHVHALAAFAVALFVWRWLARRDERQDTPGTWIEWGLLAGLMTLVYQINGVLLLLPAFELWRLARRRGLAAMVRSAGIFAAAVGVAWLPHFAAKAVVYGTPWTTGYQDRFFVTSPRILQTAFSAEHGLFSWTPIALVAVAGLAVLARRRTDARVLLAAAAVFFYAVASYQNWHGQSSFGNRFFVSLTVLAVIGLAAIARQVMPRGRAVRASAIAVTSLLVLWNAGLAFQWGTDLVPSRGPVDFRMVARNQVTTVPGAALRFLRSYLTSRDATTRQLERQDSIERRDYKLVR